MRARRHSVRTETACAHWIRRPVLFHGKRHPETLAAADIESFHFSLAAQATEAAATRNRALEAWLFLYREVLRMEPTAIDSLVRASTPGRRPTVLSRGETSRILGRKRGVPLVMATVLSGAGLPFLECARPRGKDVDFECRKIVVRAGTGKRSRGPAAGERRAGAADAREVSR